jgi:hypothetical protein
MLLDPYYANDGENKWGYPLTGRPKLKKKRKEKRHFYVYYFSNLGIK